MIDLALELPEKLDFLLTEKHRWKVCYGGRDATRSWSFSRALLALGTMHSLRILCCRELQSSIEDSVLQLLDDQITRLGLRDFYEVQRSRIIGMNGTTFGFEGLRHNANELKSWEGADIAWVEEANNVTRHSWDTLEPTIRKPGSEIWATFNPELETDETYQRFVVHPPDDAKVVHMTYRDNPWPSAVLESGRERMRQDRPDDYENIWEGQPRTTLADAILSEEMKAVQRENRITRVPYASESAVNTYWDLGFGNHTSIWCAQRVGLEWRILAFIQDSNKYLPYYVTELGKLPYVWGTDFLPHDARNNTLGAESIEKQMKALKREVEVLPATDDVTVAINAARAVLPFCYFDREKTADGVQCLRHWRWKKNNDGIVIRREPMHDGYSDGADAFVKIFAMARNRSAKKQLNTPQRAAATRHRVAAGGGGSWMGA